MREVAICKRGTNIKITSGLYPLSRVVPGGKCLRGKLSSSCAHVERNERARARPTNQSSRRPRDRRTPGIMERKHRRRSRVRSSSKSSRNTRGREGGKSAGQIPGVCTNLAGESCVPRENERSHFPPRESANDKLLTFISVCFFNAPPRARAEGGAKWWR